MWNQPLHRPSPHHRQVPEGEEILIEGNQPFDFHLLSQQHNQQQQQQLQRLSSNNLTPNSSGGLSSSSSQVSLSYTSQRSLLNRSQSLGSVKHQSVSSSVSSQSSLMNVRRATVTVQDNTYRNNNNTMMNETFRLPQGPYFAAGLNQQAGVVGGGGGGNPFLDNPKCGSGGVGVMNPLLAMAAQASQQQQQQQAPMSSSVPMLDHSMLQQRRASPSPVLGHCSGGLAGLSLTSKMPTASSVAAGRGLGGSLTRPPRIAEHCSVDAESITSLASASDEEPQAAMIGAPKAPSPTPIPTLVSDTSVSMNNNIHMTGPSKLYRLITSPPKNKKDDNYWDVILQRARSHPHEACFFDPNAGGHVYALHRLLRRTGDDDDDFDEEEDGPPVEVVEAVMQACPRALTRKQAMIDEDDLMMDNDSNSTMGESSLPLGETAVFPPQGIVAAAPRNNNPLQQDNNNMDEDNDGEGDQQEADEDDAQEEGNQGDDHDDVRFEYPLAIACECEQGLDIVRLLASYLSKTKPVYRSEVFRSLDYASLPNSVVRILLEEYAGCVLERGMNSEATEGDDDDCPLEQVLFWWDDPDMMGMEEEILEYPNCNMRHDLCDLWEKLRMMLYAATNSTMAGYDDSKESFQVLHHLLRIVSEGGIRDVKFPNDFAHAVLLLAKFIQREKPGMFEERDETGSLPLHIAVTGDRLLRRNDRTCEREEDGTNAQGEDNDGGQPENDAGERGEAMDGVVQADGDGPVGMEAQQQNEQPGPPQAQAQGGPAVAAQQAEEEEDEEEDEEDEDEGDEDDQDIADTTSNVSYDMEIVRLLLDQHPASIRLRDSQSGSLPIHLALQHNPLATEAIEHFLDLYPRSVTMPDGNGRLPVHLALIRESPAWNKVLSLSPKALESRDPATGLLPFQLAAMFKPEEGESKDETAASSQDPSQEGCPGIIDQQEELDSLSTTFELLRMSPCLASGLADVKQRPQSVIEQQIMLRYKPRVTKLEEENEKLRRKVEELELQLACMKMGGGGADVAASLSSSFTSLRPSLKKRKSSVSSSGGYRR